MGKNLHVVVIEDSAKDAKQATRLLNRVNIENVTVFSLIPAVLMYLEDVVEGKRTCPDLILVDLVVGADSGFEVLRYYKAHPELSACQVVVWTVMGDVQHELCKCFGVQHIVAKADGVSALLKVLKKITAELSTSV
jgi:CheY-like chemotaxis protein